MCLFPSKYGLENVRKISRIKFEDVPYRLAFDEIGGLKWEEKVKQQYNSFLRIFGTLRDLEIDYPDYIEDIHVLFYLYSEYCDKQTIRTIYRRYFSEMKRKQLKEKILYTLKHPKWAFLKLSEVWSIRELRMLFR